MFGSRYDPTKLKLNLKLAVTRLQMLQKKNENQGLLARKEIAKLLEKGKDELARIKVEQVIRDDYLIEVMELMEMYCSLVSSRFGLIDSVKFCDEGIREAVCTIIWVTPRLMADVGELKTIQQYLIARYGKEFGEDALENKTHTVNDRVIQKLSIHQPPVHIVDGYLLGIAQTCKVNWTPPDRTLEAEMTQMQAGIPTVPTDMFPSPPGKESPFLPAQNPAFATASMAYPVPPPSGAPFYPPQGLGYPPQAPSGPRGYPPPTGPSASYSMAAADPSAAYPGYNSLPNLPAPAPAPVPTFDQFPTPSAGTVSTNSDAPDFDELTRRFQNLKGGK